MSVLFLKHHASEMKMGNFLAKKPPPTAKNARTTFAATPDQQQDLVQLLTSQDNVIQALVAFLTPRRCPTVARHLLANSS